MSNELKELDQRSDTELLFRCACGGDHFLSFDYSIDPGYSDYSIATVDPISAGLWERIWRAVRYIFKGGKIWWHQAYLTKGDLIKLQAHYAEYLEESSKPTNEN